MNSVEMSSPLLRQRHGLHGSLRGKSRSPSAMACWGKSAAAQWLKWCSPSSAQPRYAIPWRSIGERLAAVLKPASRFSPGPTWPEDCRDNCAWNHEVMDEWTLNADTKGQPISERTICGVIRAGVGYVSRRGRRRDHVGIRCSADASSFSKCSNPGHGFRLGASNAMIRTGETPVPPSRGCGLWPVRVRQSDPDRATPSISRRA